MTAPISRSKPHQEQEAALKNTMACACNASSSGDRGRGVMSLRTTWGTQKYLVLKTKHHYQ